MFGDIGHGSMLLLFSSILCLGSNCLRDMDGFRELMPYRYLLLLMGVFSTYCGLIYNDFVSIPLTLATSCYDLTHVANTSHKGNHTIGASADCVYPIGVDPAWIVSKNELQFMNSLKMKMSVIIGVMQMGTGIIMKALNSLYFKRYMDFFHEFIPQILLLVLLFGYMDLLIIIKWLTNYSGHEY